MLYLHVNVGTHQYMDLFPNQQCFNNLGYKNSQNKVLIMSFNLDFLFFIF